MQSKDLTRRQAQAVRAKIELMRDYLYRLRKRMAKRGFPLDDPLYLKVLDAQQAIGELFMDVAAKGYSGPIEAPPEQNTEWLDRHSARKRYRER